MGWVASPSVVVDRRKPPSEYFRTVAAKAQINSTGRDEGRGHDFGIAEFFGPQINPKLEEERETGGGARVSHVDKTIWI